MPGLFWGFPGSTDGKKIVTCNAGRPQIHPWVREGLLEKG